MGLVNDVHTKITDYNHKNGYYPDYIFLSDNLVDKLAEELVFNYVYNTKEKMAKSIRSKGHGTLYGIPLCIVSNIDDLLEVF